MSLVLEYHVYSDNWLSPESPLLIFLGLKITALLCELAPFRSIIRINMALAMASNGVL